MLYVDSLFCQSASKGISKHLRSSSQVLYCPEKRNLKFGQCIEKSSYFNLIQSGINLASCVWVCSDPPHLMMKICEKFMKHSDSSSNILSYIRWIMIQSSHLSTNTQRHSMLFSVFYHQ